MVERIEMFTIRSKTESIYSILNQYMALPNNDHGSAEIYKAKTREEAENVWLCFGGEYSDFKIVEE